MNRRTLALCVVLTLAVVLSSVAGTGSFDRASVDRSLEIRVGDDDDAYLRVVDGPLRCGKPVLLRNGLDTTVTGVRMEVAVDAGSVRIAGHRVGPGRRSLSLSGRRVRPGDALSVAVEPTAGHVEATVRRITVAGADTTVSLDGTVPVNCATGAGATGTAGPTPGTATPAPATPTPATPAPPTPAPPTPTPGPGGSGPLPGPTFSIGGRDSRS